MKADKVQKVSNQMGQIKRYCEQKGIKLTPLREEILLIMYQFGQIITAYEILRQLREARPNAEPPTVYRVLEYFQGTSVIHRIASKNAYLCCINPDELHRGQLLLCDICDEANEVFNSGLIQAVTDCSSRYGFQFRDGLMEIHGVCAKCSDGAMA
ncbi:MAG: transcriptional repressor [Gammaproteobacteria bacterium]